MSSLNKIIYNIKNLVRGGNQSDNERLTDRQIEYIVNYYRNILIKRDLDKNKSINPDVVQDLGCIDLVLVDPSECCDLDIDCKVLRTSVKIPKTIELNQRNLLTYIGSVDKTHSYSQIDSARVRWSNNNKYISKEPKVYYLNNYIYVLNAKELTKISVRGIFEDPKEAASFSQCNGDPCFTNDSKYPMAEWMLQPMFDMIMKGELKVGAYGRTDEANDASGKVIDLPQE